MAALGKEVVVLFQKELETIYTKTIKKKLKEGYYKNSTFAEMEITTLVQHVETMAAALKESKTILDSLINLEPELHEFLKMYE